MNINIDPSTLKNILCECGCDTFTAVKKAKFVPKFISPTSQDFIAWMEVPICASCGLPFEQSFQKFLADQEKESGLIL